MVLFSNPPTSTVAYGDWRGGIYHWSMTSTSLHTYLVPSTVEQYWPHVRLPGGDATAAAATNPNNTATVSFPSFSDFEAASYYTVRVTLEFGHNYAAGIDTNPNKNRVFTANLESIGDGSSTLRATKSTSVSAYHRTTYGPAIPLTLEYSFPGNLTDASQFRLSLVGDIDTEQEEYGAWGNYSGLYVRNVLLEIGFQGSLAPTDDFGIHMGSTGVLPGDWHQPTLRYRALANSAVMRRHPMMPSSYGDMYALSINDGQPDNVSVHGDYLYFGRATPPYLIYWGPANTSAGYSGSTVTTGSAAALDTLLTAHSVGFWSGVEAYQQSRNLIAPNFRVTLNDLDMSSFLQAFNNGSVSFVGPPSLAEFWNESGSRITVHSGQVPIMSGVVTRAESTPYVNVRKMTLSILPTTKFHDIDLTENEKLYSITSGMPTDELTYITDVLNASGFNGSVYTSGGVEFRDVNFWTLAPPDGPGFDLEEAVTTYYNAELGTTYNLVAKVAEANMLGIYDLPNGDIGLFPLIPYVDYSLTQLLTTALPQLGGSQSTAVVRVYCDDGTGNYVADPRLDIAQISMDLDEGFAKVEVEAFSNTLTADFIVEPATFVQGSEGLSAQNRYLQASIPMFAVDSNRVGDTDSAFHASNKPWKFRVISESVPKDYFSRLVWWEETEHAPGAGETDVESTRMRTWGFPGNRWVVYEQPLIGTLAQAYTGDPDGLAAAMAQFGIPDTDTVVYGIEAGVTGTWGTGAEFRFTMKIVNVDAGTIKLEPMVGTFMPEFAPKWLPNVEELVKRAEQSKPRKAKRVTNSWVAQIGHTYAVQVPIDVINLQALYGAHYYDKFPNAGATHLASWLTCREILKTRRVELRYAGSHYWTPNQFLAIARRPEAGEGAPVVWYDVLLVMDSAQVTGEVNGEVWTNVTCAYVGAYNTTTGLEDHEMPLSWGAVWDRRGEGGVM